MLPIHTLRPHNSFFSLFAKHIPFAPASATECRQNPDVKQRLPLAQAGRWPRRGHKESRQGGGRRCPCSEISPVHTRRNLLRALPRMIFDYCVVCRRRGMHCVFIFSLRQLVHGRCAEAAVDAHSGGLPAHHRENGAPNLPSRTPGWRRKGRFVHYAAPALPLHGPGMHPARLHCGLAQYRSALPARSPVR